MKNTRHVWKIVITMVLGSMIFLACGTPDTATPLPHTTAPVASPTVVSSTRSDQKGV